MKAGIALTALLATMASLLAGCARGQAAFSGYDPGQLYNLGNAYARAGQPGLAVLSYERARLLAPDDADIEANLSRVREAAHVSAEAPPSMAVLRLPSPFMVAALVLGGLLVVGSSGIAWRRRVGPPQLLAATALAATALAATALAATATVGALMLGVAVCNAVLVWPKLHAAVVIAAQTPVRAAPAPLGDTLFVLAEAETVDVTAEHEDFVLISTALGRTGWIPQAAVAPIVPRK